MDFNSLLIDAGIDPAFVLVFRHRPKESDLRRVLPWLAIDKPNLFNSYQRIQGPTVEKAVEKLKGKGHVASFIGHAPGKAAFVALYKIEKSSTVYTRSTFFTVEDHQELEAMGNRGLTSDREAIIRFDLTETSFYREWKGKLVVAWPGKELSWWRRAHNNRFDVLAIHEDSLFEAEMPRWTAITLTWGNLKVIPIRWKHILAQWRGIYFIYDSSDGKGYVGSAYGKDNLLGRWENYAETGHGGNRLLRGRNPDNFIFSILQRVSPDMESEEVIHLESSWKDRLHTRSPAGLNDN